MSDFLVNLGANANARKIIKTLGLPIPLPQKLKRETGPWAERPLNDLPAVAFMGTGARLGGALAKTLAAAGAEIYLAGDKSGAGDFEEQGKAWGRHPQWIDLETPPENLKAHALIFDASGIATPDQLGEVHAFFHSFARRSRPCGRAVILSRPAAGTKDPLQQAARQALEGFMRSMGKEIGKKGNTALLIQVEEGAEDRLEPALRYFLSYRSAYISGQPVLLTAAVKGDAKFPATRPLDGKVALVTGAARGIGADTARALAREGAKVIGLDLEMLDGPLAALMEEIGGEAYLGDITDESLDKDFIAYIKKHHGGLDIVVHNAGVTRDKMLANMKEDRWGMVLGINLRSLIRLNTALIPILKKDARITCLSSIAGVAGNLGQTNYAASKAGVIGYVRALAPTLAAKGIAVNAIAPGFIETQMTAKIPLGTREVARRLCSLSQGGLPTDIAELVTFLSSPGAAGMTGQVLRICGGNFIGA